MSYFLLLAVICDLDNFFRHLLLPHHIKIVLCSVLGSVDVCIWLSEGHNCGTVFILWHLFYCVHFIDSVRFYCLFTQLNKLELSFFLRVLIDLADVTIFFFLVLFQASFLLLCHVSTICVLKFVDVVTSPSSSA